jgi:hypothetical protein
VLAANTIASARDRPPARAARKKQWPRVAPDAHDQTTLLVGMIRDAMGSIDVSLT